LVTNNLLLGLYEAEFVAMMANEMELPFDAIDLRGMEK
jgi:hypothetical protein